MYVDTVFVNELVHSVMFKWSQQNKSPRDKYQQLVHRATISSVPTRSNCHIRVHCSQLECYNEKYKQGWQMSVSLVPDMITLTILKRLNRFTPSEVQHILHNSCILSFIILSIFSAGLGPCNIPWLFPHWLSISPSHWPHLLHLGLKHKSI